MPGSKSMRITAGYGRLVRGLGGLDRARRLVLEVVSWVVEARTARILLVLTVLVLMVVTSAWVVAQVASLI